MSVHARINSSGHICLSWKSSVDDRNEHSAIIEVKVGKTSERAVKNRASDQLRSSLLITSLFVSAVEGSDLGLSEDPFEPTASCINDTKKRQLVTRSSFPRPRCCVCHLHHKRAMNSSAAVREFFETVLQQVCHFKVDVIAGDANSAAYKYYKKEEH